MQSHCNFAMTATARVSPTAGDTFAMPPLRAEPLTKPVKSCLDNLARMHTGSYMDLCLDDTADDQDRLQRYCDQLALAAGLRLSSS